MLPAQVLIFKGNGWEGVVPHGCADNDIGGLVFNEFFRIFIAYLIYMEMGVEMLFNPVLHKVMGQGFGAGRKDTEVDDLVLGIACREKIMKFIIFKQDVLNQLNGPGAILCEQDAFVGALENLDVQFLFQGVDNGA